MITDAECAEIVGRWGGTCVGYWQLSDDEKYAFSRAVNLLELQHEANIRCDKMLAKKYPHLFASDDDPTPEEWELIKEDLRVVVETGFFPDRTAE